MILYTYSDPKGQIYNLLEADVKSILHFEMPDEEDCLWRIKTHEGDTYPALDVVRMEIDGSGLPHTGIIVDETDDHYAYMDAQMMLEDKEMGLRTFGDGDQVNFDLRGMIDELDINHSQLDRARLELHDNQDCLIMALSTYSELGNKDYEYYDIQFADGFSIDAISGYHLTKV